MSVRIREYRHDDRSALEACIVQLQNYERQFEDDHLPGEGVAAKHLSYMLEECDARQGKFLVAEANGDILGYVSVWRSDDNISYLFTDATYAYVLDFFVREDVRGQGIGRLLLEAAEAHAKSVGEKRVMLHVLARNEAAIKAYAAMGYRPYNILLLKDL